MISSMAQKLSQLVLSQYQIVEHLGRGAFGTVWKVKNPQTNIFYALKWIPQSYIDSQEKKVHRQISLLKRLRHPNVVKLIQVIKVEEGKDTLLLFQYAKSDLLKCFEQKYLTQKQKYHVMRQLIEGLTYLHTAGVMHRDLKPSNILIDEKLNVKICDFGLSKFIQQKGTQQIHTEKIGTRWYRAPQILFGSKNYGCGVDVWSLGCLIYELFMGLPLFKGQSQIEQAKLILEFKGFPTHEEIEEMRVHENCSLISNLQFLSLRRKGLLKYWKQSLDHRIFALIIKMLQYSPIKRIKSAQILKHLTFHQEKEENNTRIKQQQTFLKTENNIDQIKDIFSNKRDSLKNKENVKELQISKNSIDQNKKQTQKIKIHSIEQMCQNIYKNDKIKMYGIRKSVDLSLQHKKVLPLDTNQNTATPNPNQSFEKDVSILKQGIFSKIKLLKINGKDMFRENLKRLGRRNANLSQMNIKPTQNMKILIFDSAQSPLPLKCRQPVRIKLKKLA